MKNIYLILLVLFVSANSFAQNKSTHQEQLEHYNSLNNANANWYEQNTVAANKPLQEKAACNLNKVVYGWHPYWGGSAHNNYDWDLLSHLSFFSYEVDAATGNANDTHGWSTSAAVDAALASGNTKVTLCVTLFSGHSTFFASPTAQQTLITNLINLVQSRGAHGVNIDFEGIPSSEKTNFANFMVDLSNQMHAAIPGSEVSTVLYAVDWNNVFDFSIMEPVVDHYIIMGYAYYYQGSSTTGPCDPLYHYGSTYNYTLSRTTTYYLDAGCPAEKLVMGLPYYGYEWETTSLTVPSSTVASGSARTFEAIMDNTSGNYSAGNHQYDWDSYSDIYAFNNGANKQCFITLEDGFRKRLDHINKTGIAGIGIWALGYDDGYNELWNGISDYLTDCYVSPCSDTIHDFGGPKKDYYNDENYTWTIAPQGALDITVNFTEFDVELNYDYLYIYDGPTTASPQISGSPFTGTAIPPSFTSSTGALTFKFTSDGATVAPGFLATYTCSQDNTPPTTNVSTTGTWKTNNFTATFADTDNTGIDESYYQIADFDGTEWRSNSSFGFFNDEFNQGSVHADWTSSLGAWNTVSTYLEQTDEAEGNSNLYTNLTQGGTNTYVYNWQGQINGVGTNRRAGLHFFCDDATQSNRGNSYLVYWRVDSDKCQIYEITGNSIVLMTNDDVIVDPNITYDFKISYDPISGEIKAFLDDTLVSQWTDNTPLTTGNSISVRTGNCIGTYDKLRVYKSRTSSEVVSIGNVSSEIRYQNTNPTTPSGRIASIVIDGSNNWSVVNEKLENIDWTSPSDVIVADGLTTDIDTFYVNTEISANWSLSTDPHSDIVEYQYAVGTAPSGTDIVNWTSNGTNISITHTGLNLTYGTTYYVSTKAINGAGLESNIISSNGQYLLLPTQPPVSSFTIQNTSVCEGDPVLLINASTNATTFSWNIPGASPSTSSLMNPYVVFPSSGNYNVTLTATGLGGTDISNQTISISIIPAPIASATPDADTLYLPNTTVMFTNSSTDATSYAWNFGNGDTSTDSNPSTDYTNTGNYTVTLIAGNATCDNDTSFFTITVLDATGISEYNFQAKTYPNPTGGLLFVNIFSNSNQNISFNLYSSSGQLVTSFYQQNITSGNNTLQFNLNSKGIETGFYLLKLEGPNNNTILPILYNK